MLAELAGADRYRFRAGFVNLRGPRLGPCMTEDITHGWDSISRTFEALYPGQEPKHFGTMVSWSLGGPDPLDGISYFVAERGDHWHIVTYGLSELYDKQSEDLERSGWGFEFTMRLEKTSDEPPMWSAGFLQNLARYVFKSGNVFAPGHHIDLNGPMSLEDDGSITAAFFDLDSEAGVIRTPHGTVQFIQILGGTAAELKAAKRWQASKVIELLRESDPAGVVRLGRACLSERPEFDAAVNEGVKVDGSSTGQFFIDALAFEPSGPTLTLGALQVEPLRQILPGRLPHGRPFTMVGQGIVVGLAPAEQCLLKDDALASQNVLEVHLSPEAAAELVETLQPKRGTYKLASFPGLEFKVVPTVVRDPDGKPVKTVG